MILRLKAKETINPGTPDEIHVYHKENEPWNTISIQASKTAWEYITTTTGPILYEHRAEIVEAWQSRLFTCVNEEKIRGRENVEKFMEKLVIDLGN